MENNQEHAYCSRCNQIELTVPSASQRNAFAQFPATEQRQVKLADIRWNNVCNLTCRYCNTNDSSEWRKILNLPIESASRDYTDTLFDYIEENKNTIELIYLIGGEPLMQKQNERLLTTINPQTKIDVLTNMSVKLDNNKIYKSLQKFSGVQWNLSFDNVGDRFEYVRQGGSWELLTGNIERLIDDFGASQVTLHPVYHIWNALNLEEFYDFASKKNLKVNWQIGLPKYGDSYATDAYLTFGHKRAIIERAILEIDKLNTNDPFLLEIKNSLLCDTEIEGRDKKFLEWTNSMEQFMPPAKSFASLWPELNTLLNLP